MSKMSHLKSWQEDEMRVIVNVNFYQVLKFLLNYKSIDYETSVSFPNRLPKITTLL